MPPHLRGHANELWADGNEEVTVRQAAALYTLLRDTTEARLAEMQAAAERELAKRRGRRSPKAESAA